MGSMSLPVECLQMGGMSVNRVHQDLLKGLGFHDFQSVWKFEGGRQIKDLPGRSVIRIPAERAGGRRHVYLKRHTAGKTGPGAWWVRRATGKHSRSPGLKEFENICSFRKHGLATVVPIAAGENRSAEDATQSFILTEDFSPYVQLEALLRDDPEFFMGATGVSRKETLLSEIARMAGQMHQAGFNHRDFNATHILLLYEAGSHIPRLALFDLERVEIGGGYRCRWPIKSIARLNQSLPEELFTPGDREHLWMAYKGKDRMDLWDMAQWLWIRRKTRRIARHTAKIMDRRKRTAQDSLGDG